MKQDIAVAIKEPLSITVNPEIKKQSDDVLVIIPAYNETRCIGSVVLAARKHVSAVMVVDDGSTDNTLEIAQAAGAIVVRHEHNQGKGAALTTGLRMVRDLRPKVVVLMDGDGQHIPAQIPIVAAPVLKGEADIVVGSRYLEPEKSNVPIHRVWGHRVFNFMTNTIAGQSTTDSQSGFRAFSLAALDAFADTILSSRGFGVESEMQMWAHDYQPMSPFKFCILILLSDLLSSMV